MSNFSFLATAKQIIYRTLLNQNIFFQKPL